MNYFKDHTKLIVGGLEDATSQSPDFIVTYINSERQSRSYQLSDLARYGTSTPIKERMHYVSSVLDEFVELDKQIS